jgi:acyl-coenzyme A synthetase/AMP-(fatty) acid ligase
MTQARELSPLPPWPARFNLAQYFLDHNLEKGRGAKTALLVGDEERSFQEVSERVRRLTAWLRAAGLRPEERVLLALSDGFEFAEAFFAVLRAGGVFAMVNPLQKREALEYALRYTKARILVADASVARELGDARRASRLLQEVLVVGEEVAGTTPYEQALAAWSPEAEGAFLEPTGPDDLAGWLFTSGSTGEPKACVHTHADFAYSTETYALQVVGYRGDDRCLSVPKLFFGYATGTNLMFPFRVGASVVLFPGRFAWYNNSQQGASYRDLFAVVARP